MPLKPDNKGLTITRQTENIKQDVTVFNDFNLLLFCTNDTARRISGVHDNDL